MTPNELFCAARSAASFLARAKGELVVELLLTSHARYAICDVISVWIDAPGKGPFPSTQLPSAKKLAAVVAALEAGEAAQDEAFAALETKGSLESRAALVAAAVEAKAVYERYAREKLVAATQARRERSIAARERALEKTPIPTARPVLQLQLIEGGRS